MSERAAKVIRTVRETSGLSRGVLAARASISARQLSEYETAVVDPTLDVLADIVAAAELDLELVVTPRRTTTHRRVQLEKLAARSIERSMTIEGKQVAGRRSVAPLVRDDLLHRITSHSR